MLSCLAHSRHFDFASSIAWKRPFPYTFSVTYVQNDETSNATELDTEISQKPHKSKGRKKSLLHRLRLSKAHTGKKHSPETREKIRQGVIRAKRKKTSIDVLDDLKNALVEEKKVRSRSVDYFVLEKAVLELSQLRREVSFWLESWYAQNERKPSLEEVSRLSPEVHNKFLRYIALQEFIRSNS